MKHFAKWRLPRLDPLAPAINESLAYLFVVAPL
jgi:hypothetical protein